jgi:hypothetical protein
MGVACAAGGRRAGIGIRLIVLARWQAIEGAGLGVIATELIDVDFGGSVGGAGDPVTMGFKGDFFSVILSESSPSRAPISFGFIASSSSKAHASSPHTFS